MRQNNVAHFFPARTMKLFLLTLFLLPVLVACDQLKERAGLKDPAQVEADGKAIGAACRLSGRGLEACYGDNANAPKAAVYAGWKEMNEYMMKNNLQEMPSGGGKAAEPTATDENKPDGKAKNGSGGKDKADSG